MIDLAIGFIIGAAFASVVESLAKNIIMDFIAAIGGQPDTAGMVLKLRDGTIHYGTFLGDLLSFVIVAFVLLMLVKAFTKLKVGNFKAQGQRECDHCKEFVAVDATRCKFCTSELEPIVRDEE